MAYPFYVVRRSNFINRQIRNIILSALTEGILYLIYLFIVNTPARCPQGYRKFTYYVDCR